MRNKFIMMLAAGHMVTDINQGALPAILPFLITAGGLSYAHAAGLSFALAFSSSLIQPLFGIWADKKSMSWLLPFGVLTAGVGLALIGPLQGNYWLMFTAAIISGIGIAAYHPEAARKVNQLAGKKKGGGMSIFSVGGNLGFAMGPALATPALLFAGLSGSLVLALPAAAMCILFLINSSKVQNQISAAINEERSASSSLAAPVNEWGLFVWLTVAIVCRSIIFHNIHTFLPLYWINVLGYSKATAGIVLTMMFLMGAVSTLIGGFLADRLGTNWIVKVGWVIPVPLLFFFTWVTHPVLVIVFIILITFGLYTMSSPMMVLGQKYLPGRLGLASGITFGLGVSIGGITTPLIGHLADLYGLAAALQLIGILPFVGALVALTLRRPLVERK